MNTPGIDAANQACVRKLGEQAKFFPKIKSTTSKANYSESIVTLSALHDTFHQLQVQWGRIVEKQNLELKNFLQEQASLREQAETAALHAQARSHAPDASVEQLIAASNLEAIVLRIDCARLTDAGLALLTRMVDLLGETVAAAINSTDRYYERRARGKLVRLVTGQSMTEAADLLLPEAGDMIECVETVWDIVHARKEDILKTDDANLREEKYQALLRLVGVQITFLSVALQRSIDAVNTPPSPVSFDDAANAWRESVEKSKQALGWQKIN